MGDSCNGSRLVADSLFGVMDEEEDTLLPGSKEGDPLIRDWVGEPLPPIAPSNKWSLPLSRF